MSQQQTFGDGGAPGIPGIESVTGNTGGAVFGSGSPVNVNFIGDTVQGVHVNGNAGTSTETITVDTATTLQKGVVLLATNAEAISGTDTAKAITSDDLKAKLGTQTSHGLPYGNTTSGAVQWLAEASNGQIPIGSTGNAPVLANITSTDGSVTITNGAGSIDLSVANNVMGTGQTIGAVTADLITFNLGATPGTYAFEGRVAGFNAATPASCAFQIFGTVRTTGAAAVLVGVPDYVSNDEPAVNTADAEIVVSGNTAIIRVTGVAALTIDWGADLQYTFRG